MIFCVRRFLFVGVGMVGLGVKGVLGFLREWFVETIVMHREVSCARAFSCHAKC